MKRNIATKNNEQKYVLVLINENGTEYKIIIKNRALLDYWIIELDRVGPIDRENYYFYKEGNKS